MPGQHQHLPDRDSVKHCQLFENLDLPTFLLAITLGAALIVHMRHIDESFGLCLGSNGCVPLLTGLVHPTYPVSTFKGVQADCFSFLELDVHA